ncbi:hypothetical protein RND81_14G040700 [Saponaria officinalis]|uniref:Cysteine-rich transmembrane domain-containing protein n=1 Tax=Saponaria officinalis TaxID=3572 RepID=A0AAW1GN87_SAPOF
MTKTETTQQQQTMDNVPPPGYPTLTTPERKTKKGMFRSKQRGDKGFIEGCLAALCCCWICEECCC